jgi:hypothetical protein
MAEFLSRRWTRQPQYPASVDAQLANNQGLVYLSWRDSLIARGDQRRIFSRVGTTGLAGGLGGIGPTFTASGANRFSAPATGSFLASDPFTIEVLCAITATPSLGGFAGLAGVVNRRTRGLISFGGLNNRNIYFWGRSADLDSGVEWSLGGQLQHVMVTSDGVGLPMIFYRDGVQIASGTTPSLLDSVDPTYTIGDMAQGWNATPTGTIFKSAYYRKALSPGEIRQLTSNPWQIFQSRRALVYAVPEVVPPADIPALRFPQTDLPRDQRGGADAFDNGLGGELLTLDYFGFAAPSGAISATSTSTLEAIAGAVTGTVASAGINATTSVTLDAVAGSAAAAVRVAATTAATLGAVVGAVTGTVRVAATSSAALGEVAGSATATVLATATSSATLATVTGAVTAVVGNTISATTSATLEGLAGSATAAVRVAASTTGTLATITGSATGAVRIAAGTTATLDTVAGSVTGVVANQVFATTTAVLAGVAGAVTATARIEATSAATLQALEGNAAAAVLGLATSTATLAGVTGSASIFGGVIRVLSSAATLAEVVGAASAITIEIGDQAPSRARIGRKTLAQSARIGGKSLARPARIGSEVLRGKNTTTRH